MSNLTKYRITCTIVDTNPIHLGKSPEEMDFVINLYGDSEEHARMRLNEKLRTFGCYYYKFKQLTIEVLSEVSQLTGRLQP